MIDIHAHILPGLDDGARDYETAIIMGKTAADNGVTDIIATPHANQRGRYENYASEDLNNRLTVLSAALRHAEIPVTLHLGMEVFGTPDVPELLQKGKVCTLAGSRYLLVEFAFRESPLFMEDLLHRLRAEGVLPVVAHPERYRALQDMPEIMENWAAEGFALQINKGSLTGSFGHSARRTAYRMLEHDLASLIASDAHGADRPGGLHEDLGVGAEVGHGVVEDKGGEALACKGERHGLGLAGGLVRECAARKHDDGRAGDAVLARVGVQGVRLHVHAPVVREVDGLAQHGFPFRSGSCGENHKNKARGSSLK